jgi:hypothetical protein
VPDHSVYAEVFYSGAWQRVPMLNRKTITTMRGAESVSADLEPASASGTIDNTSGAYAPKSVLSPLYGLIGIGTPGRVSADGVVQMTGEVSSWRPTRPVKGSGSTDIDISGVLTRLGIGTDDIRPALERATLATAPDGLVGYWPLSEGKDATSGTNLVAGGAQAAAPSLKTGPTFGGLDAALVPAGLSALPDYTGGGSLTATVRGTSTTSWRVEFVLGFASGALAGYTSTALRSFLWTTGGGITTWWCEHGSDYFIIYGTSPFIAGLPFGATVRGSLEARFDDGRPHYVTLDVSQTNSTTMAYAVYVDGVLEDSGSNTTGALIGRQQIGAPLSWTANPDSSTTVQTVGSVTFYSPSPVTPVDPDAFSGYTGELPEARFQRLCTEEGVTSTVVGTPDSGVLMGPQTTDPLLRQFELIRNSQDALIFETKTALGLTMRLGPSLVNQSVALTISYIGHIQPPLLPLYGTEGIRNDVTAKNPDGSDGRAVDTSGTYGTAVIGRYSTSIDVDVYDNAELRNAAGWRLSQGTYTGTRYASVTLDLDAAPGLAALVEAVDIGDLVQLTQLPVEDTISNFFGIIIGIKNTLFAAGKQRKVTLFFTPADPYRIGILANTSGDTAVLVGHLETDGSTAAAAAAGATSLTVSTPSGPLWSTTADDYPQDFLVGGQRVTVSAVTGAASPQTFTLTATPTYAVPASSDVTVYQPIVPAL